MKLLGYIRLWLACARYSVMRTMMFRFDTLMWALVELFWMSVNILTIEVIYSHTDSIAGWNEYEMLLLVGTAMIMQRLFMGFFWSNLFELGRNVRTGHFDFFLAQPGNPLFMVSTRKLDIDGLANVFVAASVVVFAAHKLDLHPGFLDIALYVVLLAIGLVIHYSTMVLVVSLTFWIVKTEGLEGTYFTMYEFSRLPRQAFKGVNNFVFVYALPVVIVSNAPARTLLHGPQPDLMLWLFGAAAAWFSLAVFVFNRGLRRYASASS
ncbi:MAG: ABC-2 family transporter protein [Verrucomicrobia bacterium]|nr:ABC-2 family transporter protein [Verrucomicrobiota bacterium]